MKFPKIVAFCGRQKKRKEKRINIHNQVLTYADWGIIRTTQDKKLINSW